MSTKALRTQLLAAIAMVLVAAIALGSSTYAWFVGQNTVTAEGMSVKAQAEGGIVIKSADNGLSEWATTATRNMTAAKALFPTSTYDLDTWVHAVSIDRNDETAEQDYASYTNVTALTEQSNELDDYRLKSTFLIRAAAAGTPVTNVKLAVNSITVDTSASNSESLDKALRVGVKLSQGGSGTEYYIYAPKLGGDFTLNAKYVTDGSTETLTEKQAPDASIDRFALTSNTIDASDTTCVKADIYLWFEGEDENCKSTNLTASLDDINVTVVFGTVAAT